MTTAWISRRNRVVRRALLMVAFGAVMASPVPATGQVAEGGQQVTFTKDIAPILQRSCQKCHRPDGGAPISLITYEDVRPWARSIKYRTGLGTQSDVMPPWYIEKDLGIQDYKGDISLSAEEIEKIATWTDNGAPRGNPADMPPALTFVDSSLWEIGEPDLIVSSPSVEVAATSPDWWGPIGETATGLTEDRYVSAIEMKEVNSQEPNTSRETVGSKWAIHHMIWRTVSPRQPTPEEMARLQKEDPNEFERIALENAGAFWPFHEVGRNADYFDPTAGLLLKAGSRLAFTSAHLHSTGSHTTTHLDVAFKFHPRGYKPTRTTALALAGTLDLGRTGKRGKPEDRDIPDPAAAREAHRVRAAPACGRGEDVSGRDLFHRSHRDTELCRIQPQLGQGLPVRRRRGTTSAERYDLASHGLFRHDAGEQERGRREKLVGTGSPFD